MKKPAAAVLCTAGALGAAYLFSIAPGPRRDEWTLFENYRYAHRGLHCEPDSTGAVPACGVIPENSLAAFRRAAENGFGAELDVHLTADGRLLVIHDSDLRRMTGRTGTAEELTAAEREDVRLLGTEEKIPYLEEVLPIFEKSGTPLIVEIKPAGGNHAALTAAAAACLDRFSVSYCMESFDPRVLLWLRENRPEILRGQLAMDYRKARVPLSLKNRIFLTNLLYNERTRPDFIAYEFSGRKNLSARICCGPLGGHEVNWTIRSRSEMDQAEREGHLVIFEHFIP